MPVSSNYDFSDFKLALKLNYVFYFQNSTTTCNYFNPFININKIYFWLFVPFKHLEHVRVDFITYTSTKSINFSKSWWAFTSEGTGGVNADVVVARAGIRFAFVHVLLTRFPGPPWFADTPLYIVTCLWTTSTFARGFTVFSIEKLATGYIMKGKQYISKIK